MRNFDIASIAAAKLRGYELFAEQVGKSRFMVLCMDIGANPNETKEIEKIANSFRYSVKATEAGVELGRSYLNSPYEDIIENGMPAPKAGGSGGLVHMPDGTTRSSNVPHQLWGNEIPEYAKQGTSAFREMDMMQSSLFPQEVKAAIQASRSDLAKLVKGEMVQKFK